MAAFKQRLMFLLRKFKADLALGSEVMQLAHTGHHEGSLPGCRTTHDRHVQISDHAPATIERPATVAMWTEAGQIVPSK